MTCIKYDIYQCQADEHANMDGWEICVSGTCTRGEIPCTSTRVLVLAGYGIQVVIFIFRSEIFEWKSS